MVSSSLCVKVQKVYYYATKLRKNICVKKEKIATFMYQIANKRRGTIFRGLHTNEKKY